MKKFNKAIISFILIFTLTLQSWNVFAETTLYEQKESQIVTSGLTYEKKTKLTADGFVDIHVLKMDLSNEHIDLTLLRSLEGWGVKDSLSNMMSEDENIVSGINSSFFNMLSTPSDIVGSEYNQDYSVIRNKYNMETNSPLGLIETFSGEIFLDVFGADISLKNENGREIYAYGINKIDDLSGAVIFNRNAILSSEYIDGLARMYKIVVENDTVIQVADPDTHVDIPENGYIVTINEAIASSHIPYYYVGMGMSLDIQNNLNRDDLKLVISGGGKILEDGKLVEGGYLIEPNKRHPRSAVGITADEKYLIAMVVDGRGSSIGATHKEMATYLLEYNVSDAIHFDGGGSSTLISRNLGEEDIEVYNTPSDGRERKVVNGLGFVTTAPQGNVSKIIMKVSEDRVFKNNPITIEVTGYDEYYNPVEIDQSQIFWGNQGVTGIWEKNTFIPQVVGSGKLSCYYNNLSASVNIVSVGEYIDLEVQPHILNVKAGQKGEFTIIGTDKDGYKSVVDSDTVTAYLANNELGSFNKTEFLASKNETGISKVVLSVDDMDISAYVVVGDTMTQANAFNDIQVSTIYYPNTVMGEALLVEKEIFEDNKGLQLNYQFNVSNETQAVYATFEDLVFEDDVNRLGLNIYGDNSGHMVRGKIVGADNTTYNITFAPTIDWDGWQYVEVSLPEDIVYPVKLERIYVVALEVIEQTSGSLYIDNLMKNKDQDLTYLEHDIEEVIEDPLLASMPADDDFVISVFGATSGRNRLLDDVILNKVYEEMSDSDVAVFAGKSAIDTTQLPPGYLVWNNTYTTRNYDNVKIITLATDNDGLLKTDANQWANIEADLVDSVQNNIIIIGNGNPLDNEDFTNAREGELLHNILKEYQNKTGKNVFYINASGYDSSIDYYEGIRYIDINGLWYEVSDDNEMILNNTFYMIDFYIDGNKLKYNFKNLYPKVEIN